MKRMLAVMLAATLSSPGAAQVAPAPTCTTIDANLPPPLGAWDPRAAAAEANLTVGRSVVLTLRPIAQVRYAATPERPGTPGSFGAATTIDIPRAGTYRVALGGPAWIDLVGAGQPIASTAHGHGPACSSIRKIVTFPLAAGRYTLQVSGSAIDRVAVLVVPAQ